MSIYENNNTRYDDTNNSDRSYLPYTELNDIITNLIDFNDSVIFLNGDIDENTLVDVIIKIRALLKSGVISNT